MSKKELQVWVLTQETDCKQRDESLINFKGNYIAKTTMS